MTNSRTCAKCGIEILPESNFCHKCGTLVNSTSIPEETLKNNTPSISKSKNQSLYQAFSTVNNFRYNGILYDNLTINWFVVERNGVPVPCETAIVHYSQMSPQTRIFPENYLKERFTAEEVQLLKEYLTNVQKINVQIDEVKLPIPQSSKGYRDFPPGPGTDFFPLHRRNGYPLEFKVEGIFNIKLADERIIPDERATVISRNLKDLLKEKLNK